MNSVWATHPQVKNLGHKARGRVLHIPRPLEDKKFDYKATYCGMAVVRQASSWEEGNRGLCFQCQNIKHAEEERKILQTNEPASR